MELKQFYNKACMECDSLKWLYVISEPLCRLFIFLRVSANMISIGSTVFLVAGVYYLSQGKFWGYCTLLFLSLILDIADGTVARATNTSSRLGAFLDHFFDKVKIFILFSFYIYYFDDIYISLISCLNLGLFFFICILNLEVENYRLINTPSLDDSVETKPQGTTRFSFYRRIYNSLFLMYGNFFLYFLPIGFSKLSTLLFLLVIMLVEIKNFRDLVLLKFNEI